MSKSAIRIPGDLNVHDMKVHIEITQFQGSMIDKLKKFRRKIWMNQTGGNMENVPEFLIEDVYDADAVHFIARHDQEIVGSARLSVENDFKALTKRPMFKEFKDEMNGKIGLLERLVVDLGFRNGGLGQQLELERMIFASLLNCNWVVAGVPQSRLAGLQRRGFKILFSTQSGFEKSTLPPPIVLYRDLKDIENLLSIKKAA